MVETVSSSGTGTLPVSGPNVVSTVTITDGSVDNDDAIIVTPTSRVEDADGTFHPVAPASASTGSFIVTADREQLPTAMTFNYISVSNE